MIEVIEEVPYGSRDISNIIDDSIPISVEVVPHKAYLIEEHSNLSSAYLNFQMFRLTENRINRDIIRQNRENSHIENAHNLIKRIKCILFTMISIPIIIILLGYVSTIWNRR
jgi:hypothetical protein